MLKYPQVISTSTLSSRSILAFKHSILYSWWYFPMENFMVAFYMDIKAAKKQCMLSFGWYHTQLHCGSAQDLAKIHWCRND